MATVQPLTGDDPAVTRAVATNLPVHWLVATVAVQPPSAGGAEGPSERIGVCQSRHWERSSALLPAILKPQVEPPERRNCWMFARSGACHSDRVAQWVPSWTSDQYVMLSPAPSAL
ncbi:hypothetical protein [Actinomadura geliboluensis]|uniref:hypothetical protein n=1 Tax=Actinomadura geliboluensis TaxID=882440 RepID=UPI0036AB8D05